MRGFLNAILWLWIGAALGLAGCPGGLESELAGNQPPHNQRPESSVALPTVAVATAEPGEPSFEKELLKAAAEYMRWGRVDDEFRWAPWLCRNPKPGRVRTSASRDDQTHGQKLYSLFARNRNEYLAVTADPRVTADSPVTVGQVIVKQSWIPEEITDVADRPKSETAVDERKVIHSAVESKPTAELSDDERDHFYPYVWKEGKVFKASKQADLFIMLKLDPTTPGTDTGWVYGTVTPDGKTVTSAGRVESCMKCHAEAKGDRLFGLAPR